MSSQNTLPNQLQEFHTAPLSKKSTKEYGKLIAQKLIGDQSKASGGYYVERNNRFAGLRKLAQGRQDMTEFLDFLGIDGKEAFVKLDTTPPAILPKFLDIVVERFMELQEKPTVRAVDKESKKRIQREKDEAEFAMNMGGVIQGLEDEAGVPMIDPNKYVPESYDDLELHFEMEYRLPEEIKFEKKIYEGMMDGGYEVFKRSILFDLAEVGMAWAFVYKDSFGNKKYRRCHPENMVYSWSNYDDFRDCTVVGELEKMKLADVRMMWPGIDERKLLDMFNTTCQSSGRAELSWSDEFRWALVRPYDDAVIEVFHFQVVTTEDRMWVEKKDKYGKSVLDEKKERPKYLGENKELIEKRMYTVYSGCYSNTTGEMLEWKVMENMIKPHYAMHEAFTNYVGFMPNNRDMTNMSLTERSLTAVRMLSLIQLKKQHLIAKMRPDGLIVGQSALQNVNLGLGEDKQSALGLQSQFDQTGVMIYNDMGDDGELIQRPPITPINSTGNAGALQALDMEYQFWLEKLRSDLGTNEYVEGQSVNPKLGLGVMENQVQASNRATNFIYRGYLSILEGIAKRMAIMDWYDVVENGAPEYGITPDDVVDKIFDIRIEMAPTEQDRLYIEQMAQTALSAGLITFEEAIKVRRHAKENVKLAEIYLAKYEAKRKREAAEQAARDSQLNGQVQQQSAMAKAEADAQLLQMKGQLDMQKQGMLNDGSKTTTLGTVVNTLIGDYAKMGKGIADMPPEYQAIIQAFMQNALGTQQLQSMQNQQQAQAMQQQAVMEQMQSQQQM